MRKTVVLLVVLFTAFTSANGVANGPAAGAANDEMRKLDFLAGEWKGDAWMQIGPGNRAYVLQTERVQSKLGGQVLLVEGLGKRKLENGTAGDVVHDALAVISWNAAKKTYRFATWVAGRPDLETTLDLTGPNTAVWGFDTPQGRMRYTIRLTEKGEWNEVGEMTRDHGATWTKFFEMTLQKTAGR
ncbi:MAG TPA: hypothetical protein VF911_09315 [Thermoanaerobaculia bacterium]